MFKAEGLMEGISLFWYKGLWEEKGRREEGGRDEEEGNKLYYVILVILCIIPYIKLESV